MVRQQLPPGPRGWVPGGVFRELRRGPLEFLVKNGERFGDIWSFSAFGVRYVVVNHPELVKEVLLTQAEAFWKGPALQNSKGILGEGLLTAEGETHKLQRRMMTPAFHAKQVASYAGVVRECTSELCERWGRPPEGGAPNIRIRPDLMRLTLLVAGRALFGTLLEGETEVVSRSMETLVFGFGRAVVPWGKWLSRLPLKSTRELAKARDDLRGLIGRMIAERRGAAGEGMHDLLSMLIAATDPESTVRLTDTQLVDQAVTILTAGHETTANAMTFTLWLLAKYAEEQRRLREELEAVGGEVGVETMEKVPRLRWVLSESMRLLPPVWTVGRQNQRAMELGGYRLPAKCTVLVPQWVVHRDKRWWGEDAAEFRPERWGEGGDGTRAGRPCHERPRFAYFPFSTGPRNCIGEAFGWLEMGLALGMLVRQFEFSLPEGDSGELQLMPSITLRPRSIVMLRVVKK